MDEAGREPLRTLIVDGNQAFAASVYAWAAGRADLVVVGRAGSGPEALDAVERLDPDLVLVDAVLPVMDGFRVVRLLKERPRPPLAVVTTFLAGTPVREAAYAAGADGFVAKDDFTGGFELLLEDLHDRRQPLPRRSTTPAKSVRPGSRTEPAP